MQEFIDHTSHTKLHIIQLSSIYIARMAKNHMFVVEQFSVLFLISGVLKS